LKRRRNSSPSLAFDRSDRPEIVTPELGHKKAKRETTSHRGNVEMEIEE